VFVAVGAARARPRAKQVPLRDLEEIRRLFQRYRQTARHAMVIERDEPAALRRNSSVGEPSAHEYGRGGS
jgi:hypothetical protein